MSDVTQGSLTPEQVAEHTDALTHHYGERVAPVGDYCQGFYDWEKAIAAKVDRLEAGTEYEANYGDGWAAVVADELERWRAVLDALRTIGLPIAKSSMLGRRIYGGEKLRTEMCPEHRGQWSGLAYAKTLCGCDLTGWLPSARRVPEVDSPSASPDSPFGI